MRKKYSTLLLLTWIGLVPRAAVGVNLFYDASNGSVIIDSLSTSEPLAGFTLENDIFDPPDFNAPGVAYFGDLPNIGGSGSFTQDTPETIGWFDFGVTFTGVACLGDIFPTGLTASDLDTSDPAAFLTRADYVLSPNVGILDLQVFVVSPDLDGSGVVDALDVQMLIDNNGSTTHPALDLDGNGTVQYAISPSGTIATDSDILVRILLCTEYADANLDRRVSGADVSALSAGFNTSAGYGQGEFTGDGFVGAADVSALSAFFGFDNSSSSFDNSSSSPAQFVPEPTTASSLLAVLLSLAVSRKQLRIV